MNPSKFLTSVLLLFHFRQNSSVKVGMEGSMASVKEKLKLDKLLMYFGKFRDDKKKTVKISIVMISSNG